MAQRLGKDLLKRRVAAEGLKEIADGGMGHKKGRLLDARQLALRTLPRAMAGQAAAEHRFAVFSPSRAKVRRRRAG